MEQNTFQALVIAIPTITVLLGILINSRQIDSLRNEMRSEITPLRNEMSARFEAQHQALLRVEQVLDARLKHLEERYR